MSGAGADPWWETAFGAEYLSVYAHRDDAQAGREVAALLARLCGSSLPAGPVLDAGCGTGRHLAHFRAAGLPAIGFDYSSQLLAVAGRRAATAGAVARADLRRPPFPPASFSAIFLLFTVFGYFDDGANAAVFAHFARLLGPGGWLVLDLPEPVRLRASLVPESERPGCGGTIIHERRRLAGTRVEKEVSIRRGAEVLASWRESVRIYGAAEIDALARANGLAPDPRPDAGDGGGRMVHWLRRG